MSLVSAVKWILDRDSNLNKPVLKILAEIVPDHVNIRPALHML
jgi:hypothetical protein